MMNQLQVQDQHDSIMPSHAENISSEVDAVIEHDGPEKEILIPIGMCGQIFEERYETDTNSL